MRLGELLVHTGAITSAQLGAALRQQVVYGARLGTNLIELGYADHDAIAHGLARLHHVPAALKKHLTHYDPEAIKQIHPAVCERLSAFPFAYAKVGEKPCLVVCLRDPRNEAAVTALTKATGFRLLACAAPEWSIAYMLDRLLGVARPARFAYARPGTEAPLPRAETSSKSADAGAADDSIDVEIDEEIEDEVEMPAALQLVDLDHEDVERDFNQYTMPASGSEANAGLGAGTLPPRKGAPVAAKATPADSGESLTADESIRRIRVARNRDEVSDAAIGFVRGAFGAGLMLITKDQMALGHRGCGGRFDADTVGSILIPLAAPSAFRTAITDRRTFRGAPPADGKAIHDRLYKLFPLAGAPADVVVIPILVRDRVVSAVYAHDRTGGRLAPASVSSLDTVCAEVAAAYLRLIREAKAR